MKKLFIGFLALALAFGFSSCEMGAVQIDEIYLAKKSGGDFKEVTKFYPDDGAFYCIVELSHAPKGTKIEAVWTAVDIPEAQMRNEEIDTYSTRLEEGETHLEFNLSLDTEWPKGEYNVEIFIDGESHESIDFDVR
jgi:hypothetical protein